MINYFFTKQFIKFLVTGGLAIFFNWFSALILSRYLPFFLAVILAYFVGIFIAFTLNSFFVFSQSSHSRGKQVRRFFIINFLSIPVVLAAALIIDHLLQAIGVKFYTQTIAHMIALAMPAFATFLIYKFFVFKDKKHE